MNSTLVLNVTTRQEGTPQALRRKGLLPAVLYGNGIPPVSLLMSVPTFTKAYRAAGTSTLLDLSIDGATPRKVLIHEVQEDPLTSVYTHADFYAVSMDKEMEVSVQLEFVGTSPAVKEFGGVLVKQMDTIAVRCLPKDLVHEIAIALDALKVVGDRIRVRDLSMPAGLVVVGDTDAVVAMVSAQRAEEEEAPAEVADVSAVEVEKKGKKEEEGDGEGGTGESAGAAKEKEGKKDEKEKEKEKKK